MILGLAYASVEKGYKLHSLRLRRPDIAVLGSSRALEMRAELFRAGDTTFYNAGMVIDRLRGYRVLLDKLGHADRPRRLILAIDQWYFNPQWAGARDLDPADSSAPDRLQLIQTGSTLWIEAARGRVGLAALRGPHLGINARMRGNGFRRDGSYVYADQARAPMLQPDYEFADTLERVRTGSRRFEFGTTLDDASLLEVRRLVQRCRELGYEVVAYGPPLAPTVEREVRRAGRHTYIDAIAPALVTIFDAAGYEYFDFTSCAPLGCTDADFIDGFHPSTRVDALLLSQMSKSVPWLREALNPAAVKRAIQGGDVAP